MSKPESSKNPSAPESIDVIDREYLRDLEKLAPLGGVGKFLSELCIIYLKQAPLIIQDIDRALKLADSKAALASCFRLRGVSSTMGARHLVELCRHLESCLSASDLESSRILQERIKSSFLVTRDRLQEYTAQLAKL